MRRADGAPSAGRRVLEAFSLRRNLALLFATEPGHEPALDGVRAIAILWVLCLHGIWTRGLGQFPREVYAEMLRSPNPILRVMLRGDLGVDVFFALSGFLIGTILLRELLREGSLSFARFYWRRYLRLTPVYAVVLGLFCLVPAFPNRERALANLFYVNNFITQHRQCMPWTWSLAIEEQFYLTLPLVLVALFRTKRRVVLGLSVLLVVGLFVRAAIVLAYGFRFPMAPLMGNPQYDVMWDVLYVKPYTRYGCFLPGVLAAYARLVVPKDRLERWLRRTAKWLFPLAFVTAAAIVYAPIFDPSVTWPPALGFVYMVGYASAFAGCVAYFLLLALHRCGPGVWLGRFLSLRVFRPIAQLSYATYLVHQALAWGLYLRLKPGPARGLGDHLPYIALLGAVSFFFATILHLFVERPFLALRPRSSDDR